MSQLQAVAVFFIRLVCALVLVTISVQLVMGLVRLVRALNGHGAPSSALTLGAEESDIIIVPAQSSVLTDALLAFAPAALAFITPIVFYSFAKPIARAFIPKDLELSLDIDLTANLMGRLAIGTTGLLLIAFSAPQLLAWLLREVFEHLERTAQGTWGAFELTVYFGWPEYVMQLVFGAALFAVAFRVSPFLRTFAKISGVKRPRPSSNPQSTAQSEDLDPPPPR